MLKILTVPEETKILRCKSEPVEKIDAELVAFLKELGETLKGQKDPAGVGLSAIQVGKPLRVFATFLPQIKNEKLKMKNEKPELTFYVNPEMVEHPAEMTLGQELTENREQRIVNRDVRRPASGVRRPFLEGCLSIPRIYGPVLRWPWIKVKYQILSGAKVSDTLGGLAARVFQHEVDHLNGILFTDHVLAQGNKLYREEGREMVEMEM